LDCENIIFSLIHLSSLIIQSSYKTENAKLSHVAPIHATRA